MRDRAGQAPAGAPRAGFALLLTLSMAQFMVVLDFTIVNVALPSIQNGLHVATTTLQWLVSGYAVAFGGFLLLGGRLADAYGRARLYRIGLVVFVVASIAGGLAVEPGLLIASRVVQGIGAAMLAPAGLSLLVTSYPDQQERSHALGIYGAIVSTGFASGAVLGGLLAEVTWRLVFFVNVPVGVALLVASFRLLPPDPPSSRGQLDVPGAITVTAGVALLVFAVARAGDTLRGHPASAARRGRGRAAWRVRRPGEEGAGPDSRPGPAQGPRHPGRQPDPDRGRRLQRRAGAAGDPLPAGGARAQPGAHRPVLRPAGGRGVRAGRASRPARPRARAAAGAGRRPVPRAAGPGRRRHRGAGRFAARAAGGHVRARGRKSPQPGLRPPWPAPRGRSPPGPRARPARC